MSRETMERADAQQSEFEAAWCSLINALGTSVERRYVLARELDFHDKLTNGLITMDDVVMEAHKYQQSACQCSRCAAKNS